MNILIANRQRTKKVDARRLKHMTLALLHELKIENAELGINLVGAREMARVNQQFLQHEGSTDVIACDHADPELGAKEQLHGELFICVDDAVAQAKQFGTTWQSEVARYV